MGLKILQIGKTGQVGIELLSEGALRGHKMTAFGRDQVDLTDAASLKRAVLQAPEVDVVINGAAYTAVDKAETEADLAMRVNGAAPGILAEACRERGIPLIHLSTDYVFNGSSPAPYREADAVDPINVYGRSKLAGERAIAEAMNEYVILRTSWVFSSHGANFVKTMLRLGAEREELRVVADQTGAPTSAREIARACLVIAERLKKGAPPEGHGIFHFTAAGAVSWHGFAEAIWDVARSWYGRRPVITPIPAADYPTPAKRPLNSRLDCSRLGRVYGIELVPWQTQLSAVMAELKPAKH